jgi:hypothetical protein
MPVEERRRRKYQCPNLPPVSYHFRKQWAEFYRRLIGPVVAATSGRIRGPARRQEHKQVNRHRWRFDQEPQAGGGLAVPAILRLAR